MTRMAINGLSLNVEVAGEGHPLVLLHGLTGSAATWLPFIERFAATHRVVAVDLPGHGQSDSPADPARYRIERQIEDLTTLFERLDLGEYHLLGYSMGGRVAMHLALAHRERIGRLILESASPGIYTRADRSARIQNDERLAEMLERRGIEAFIDSWERLPLFASQNRLPADVREGLRRQRLANNPLGLAGSLRGFGAAVPKRLFRRLDELPRSLLIAGELDTKYCRLARLMGKSIPGSQVVIVPDAGHTVHLEQPRTFEGIVIKFLDGEGCA